MAVDTSLVAAEMLGRLSPKGELAVHSVGRSGGDHQEPNGQEVPVLRWAEMTTEEKFRWVRRNVHGDDQRHAEYVYLIDRQLVRSRGNEPRSKRWPQLGRV
jgi:hypothetical protein